MNAETSNPTECTAYNCTNDAANPNHPAPLCAKHLPDGVEPDDFPPAPPVGTVDLDRFIFYDLQFVCTDCGEWTSYGVPLDDWDEFYCPECELGRKLFTEEKDRINPRGAVQRGDRE